ncbi:glutaredoxin [Streptomyces griseus]
MPWFWSTESSVSNYENFIRISELVMAKRLIEVFTAGCSVCEDAVRQVKDLACDNCEVVVYDLNKKCDTLEWEEKAKAYGVKSVPAVAINKKLVDYCMNNSIDIETLKAAGLGK